MNPVEQAGTVDTPIVYIIRRKALQARVCLHQEVVQTYRDQLAAGMTLPPVSLVRVSDTGELLLEDGNHRIEAAIALGWQAFPAIIREATEAEAWLNARKANGRHGLPLSRADKRKIAEEMLLHAEYGQLSDTAIECTLEQTLSARFIGIVRANLIAAGKLNPHALRKAADGRVMNTANIGRRSVDVGTTTSVNAPHVADNASQQEPVEFTHPLYSRREIVEAVCPACGRQHPRWKPMVGGQWQCGWCAAQVVDGDMQGLTKGEVKELEAAARHTAQRRTVANKTRATRDERIASLMQAADDQNNPPTQNATWQQIALHLQHAIRLIQAMPEETDGLIHLAVETLQRLCNQREQIRCNASTFNASPPHFADVQEGDHAQLS